MEELTLFEEEWFSEKPYVDAFTSGSTGEPKHIRLLKADMRQSARATNSFFGINTHSVLASSLSTTYIAGKMMVVRALEADCKLIQLPVSNSIEIPREIERIHLLPVVPSQIQSLIERAHYAGIVKNVLIGGAAPTSGQCQELAKVGYKVFISYGMTETCSHVALAAGDDPSRTFRAMPGVTFSVDSDNRLIINAGNFSFGQLQTTDVVDLLDESSFRWRGRADGVINSGGIKLFPEELESLYAPFLEGITYYVVGVEHPVWGSAPALVLEGEHDTAKIAESLREAISDHRRLPKAIVCCPEFARTPSGKLIRRAVSE